MTKDSSISMPSEFSFHNSLLLKELCSSHGGHPSSGVCNESCATGQTSNGSCSSLGSPQSEPSRTCRAGIPRDAVSARARAGKGLRNDRLPRDSSREGRFAAKRSFRLPGEGAFRGGPSTPSTTCVTPSRCGSIRPPIMSTRSRRPSGTRASA
jgi:hypothetical protein